MKKYLKYAIALLISFTISTNYVEAKSYIKDLFQAGDNITIDEKLDGTSFIAGNTIEINNQINGIGFVAGNEININYDQEYAIMAGATININKNIEKDTFIAGETVNINKDAVLNRDAYIATNSLNIKGTIKRNVYIYATSVNIKGTIDGNVVISAAEIDIDKNAIISGTLKYNEDATIKGLKDNIQTKTYKIQSNNSTTFKEYITNFISSYIHITILSIVLVFICESLLKKSLSYTEKLNSKKLLTLCGKGFLILIGVPIIAMMLLFSGAFVSVGVIGAIVYGILIYISNIFTAYFIAKMLDEKYFKKNMNSYLLMIVGLFIIYILGLLPFIGGIITFISMLLGLGIAGNMIIELKK